MTKIDKKQEKNEWIRTEVKIYIAKLYKDSKNHHSIHGYKIKNNSRVHV